MLPLSRKPEIIRLHHLQQIERTRYQAEFTNIGYNWIPERFWTLLPLLADIYYTTMTIYKCRKRLGEQYTYIIKYNQKQYQEEGLLMNNRTRLLMVILQIVQRHLVTKLGKFILGKFENSSNKLVKDICGIGVEGILEQGQYFMMMLFMLDWNPHYNLIDTILKTQYVYTFRNQSQKKIDYKIQGFMLLAVFVVRILKFAYSVFKSKNRTNLNKKLNQQFKQEEKEEEKQNNQYEQLCRICYDNLQNISSTSCGHIFCWSCIVKHLEMNPECPVCRSNCLPRQVVQLQNY